MKALFATFTFLSSPTLSICNSHPLALPLSIPLRNSPSLALGNLGHQQPAVRSHQEFERQQIQDPTFAVPPHPLRTPDQSYRYQSDSSTPGLSSSCTSTQFQNAQLKNQLIQQRVEINNTNHRIESFHRQFMEQNEDLQTQLSQQRMEMNNTNQQIVELRQRVLQNELNHEDLDSIHSNTTNQKALLRQQNENVERIQKVEEQNVDLKNQWSQQRVEMQSLCQKVMSVEDRDNKTTNQLNEMSLLRQQNEFMTKKMNEIEILWITLAICGGIVALALVVGHVVLVLSWKAQKHSRLKMESMKLKESNKNLKAKKRERKRDKMSKKILKIHQKYAAEARDRLRSTLDVICEEEDQC